MERKTVLTIMALALVAFATQVLVWVFTPHSLGNDFVGPPRSDYTLTNFTLDALDTDGQHSFTIVAPRLARKEDDGSIFVTKPDYVIVDNNQNVWKGKSESSWVNKDGSIMKLEGAVDMHRIPTEKVTPVQLLTSDLTVTTTPKDKNASGPQTREKLLDTAALTTIIDPDHVVHGIGMKANMNMKETELLADVHWISLPPKEATAP